MKSMSQDEMWVAANQLAAELSQRGIDDNIIKMAAAYTKAYPDADFDDWVYRLVQLGDLFSSSQQTATYRHEFWAVCQRLTVKPQSAHEWTLVLTWAARLYPFFQSRQKLARTVSDVHQITLPSAPPAYKPKPEALLTTLPVSKKVSDEPKKEALLTTLPVSKKMNNEPKTEAPVNPMADDIMSRLQKQGNRKL